jgi:hypothetical protein
LTETKKKAVHKESDFVREDRSIKEQLDAEPKVRVRLYQVPADSTDMPLPDQTVQLNGYTYNIPRGHSHEVPESIADILQESGHI